MASPTEAQGSAGIPDAAWSPGAATPSSLSPALPGGVGGADLGDGGQTHTHAEGNRYTTSTPGCSEGGLRPWGPQAGDILGVAQVPSLPEV